MDSAEASPDPFADLDAFQALPRLSALALPRLSALALSPDGSRLDRLLEREVGRQVVDPVERLQPQERVSTDAVRDLRGMPRCAIPFHA